MYSSCTVYYDPLQLCCMIHLLQCRLSTVPLKFTVTNRRLLLTRDARAAHTYINKYINKP